MTTTRVYPAADEAPVKPALEVVNKGQQVKLTLSELVACIETTLAQDPDETMPLHQKTDLETALCAFSDHLTPELERFMFVDETKNYTRNLIATDHDTYALMLLCWNRGKFSPIHDHPCDGCWVKVLQGQVQEIRYQAAPEEGHTEEGLKLIETYNATSSSGVSYMHDSLGLHQVGNPSSEGNAVTLHLYAPPFDKCRLWSDVDDSSQSTEAYSCYHSEFGHPLDY